MTMICKAKSKAELKAKLDAGCYVQNPTPWGDAGFHSQRTDRHYYREAVCLDPETRRRFAQITRREDGTWEVK